MPVLRAPPVKVGKVYLTATALFASSSNELLSSLVSRLEQYSGGAPLSHEEQPGCHLELMDSSSMVVAEVSDADASVGAQVMYGLHKRRLPTLCLMRRDCTEGSFAASLTSGSISDPLLTTAQYGDAAEAAAAVDAFVRPPPQPGRIFVIDGGDGAGKQTQTKLFMDRLRAEGYPVATLDYPHDSALNGKLIRTLLSGAKGDLKSVNPLLFASLYAQNRADTAPLLNHWLSRGVNVVLDRYVEANFGHQASKLPAAERPALIKMFTAFEHDWLDLPRAHRVVYLDLPPAEAAKALAADGTRAALDIHETAGDDYKTAVRDTFVWSATEFDHWTRLPCVDDAGVRYTKQELHERLYAALAPDLVNRGKPE